MCDIPFKDLRIHTIRYGQYGIAFNKIHAIEKGQFNPVLYIHKNQFLFKYIEIAILPYIDSLAKMKNPFSQKLDEYLRILGTYLKPGNLTAELSIGEKNIDDQQENNFYFEREWRSAYPWKFNEEDIETIIVPKKDYNDIQGFLKQTKYEDLPIVTYEMIENL